ncbi:PhoX family protein [Marinobacter caseinilyticus]|uniref:PhoX family protein n=1 Tax=Marinobacter caseinilyticus TaxID=2692195 RepID=UPI00140ABFB4|nr:PhoX family phosphatase [Marinobacter caseinilyticus]
MDSKLLNQIDLDPDFEPVTNPSDNRTFQSVLSARMGRRSLMKGTMGAGLASIMGMSLAGCSDDDSTASGNATSQSAAMLGFKAVTTSSGNAIVVPEGYSSVAFVPWGTPITGAYPAYRSDGTNTAEEQENQMGQNHDGMHYFPIDLKSGGESSSEGLLVMNHEYINPDHLHPAGATAAPRPSAEVKKELAAHGVSVVHVKQDSNGAWDVVFGSPFNRRVTGATEMELRGPVRGDDKLKTRFSPAGTETRGTLNNCAMGPTPWGTYLAAEENWAGYFVNADAPQPREHARYGISSVNGRYRWNTAIGGEDLYVRFNAAKTGATAADDYRNEPNTFGWMVEIDPFAPESKPQKRTALGRFGHEGVIFAPVTEGEPIVCYSGDDSRFEYIYKFVSAQPYRAATAGGYLLNEGTLYVAVFHDDGTGDWKALVHGNAGLTVADGFASQADVLLNTRLAADALGATPMDRPEWGAINPLNNEVYFTLTNNSQRAPGDTNAANPNGPNATGHIIRWLENGDDFAATSFDWDIFVFAGDAGTETVVGDEAVVTLDATNLFNSPDGLWFDGSGRLWIQTDGSDSAPYLNNMMLAADPVTREIRRFLVGPEGCEVTGVTTTPDQRTMFVNIQHPGGSWPDASEPRPRSSTVIVTKDDGGVVGS